MACHSPLRVATDDDGALDWSISHGLSGVDQLVLVPCRRCLGCKQAEAREWAIRCFHEADLHYSDWKNPVSGVTTKVPQSHFITLTYRDSELPEGSVVKRDDLRLFFRRWQNFAGHKIRQFSVGEYGDRITPDTPYGRPHYHVLAFGPELERDYSTTTSDGQRLFHSHDLDRLWSKGTATLDPVTMQSCRYVAGYVQKKAHADDRFTGPLVETPNEATGEIKVHAPHPEFRMMSRHPGLGKNWIAANYKRVYPVDQVVIDGQEYPPPTFYDRWLREHHPGLHAEVQRTRLDRRREAEMEWPADRVQARKYRDRNNFRSDGL